MAYVEALPTMVFFDASNFTNGLERHLGHKIPHHNPPELVYKIARGVLDTFIRCSSDAAFLARFVRGYWFASYRDDGPDRIADLITKHSMEPRLFKQAKGKRGAEKGVDMALGLEMLTNAFQRNFAIAILVAGDEDYAGLVGEVKRYGPRVYCAYFGDQPALSPKLRRACDRLIPLEEILRDGHASRLEELKQALPKVDVPAARPSWSSRSAAFLARLEELREQGTAAADELLRDAEALLHERDQEEGPRASG